MFARTVLTAADLIPTTSVVSEYIVLSAGNGRTSSQIFNTRETAEEFARGMASDGVWTAEVRERRTSTVVEYV